MPSWASPTCSRRRRSQPEQDKYVQVFRRAGDNLLNLINDILDLSKVEASQLELERTGFSLIDHLEIVIEMVAARAHEKGLAAGLRDRAERAERPGRRSDAAAPGAAQFDRQRGQVHREQARCPCTSRWNRTHPFQPCGSPFRTPASAFRPKNWTGCLSASPKPTPPPPAVSAAPAWGSRFQSAWWN